MRTDLRVYVAAAVIAGGCGPCRDTRDEGKASAPETPPPELAPVPRAQALSALTPSAIAWGLHPVEGLGISVPTLAGVEVRAGAMNTSAYVMQTRAPLRIALWSGAGRTVEMWRKRYENNRRFTLSPPTVVKVCGVDGVMQSLSAPAGRTPIGAGVNAVAEGAEATSEGPPLPARWERIPATTTTALGFERHGVPVIASFTVETDQRAAFAAAEKAFFAGLTCE